MSNKITNQIKKINQSLDQKWLDTPLEKDKTVGKALYFQLIKDNMLKKKIKQTRAEEFNQADTVIHEVDDKENTKNTLKFSKNDINKQIEGTDSFKGFKQELKELYREVDSLETHEKKALEFIEQFKDNINQCNTQRIFTRVPTKNELDFLNEKLAKLNSHQWHGFVQKLNDSPKHFFSAV